MHAGFSFSYSPISLLLRQPLSIKKSYAGAIHQQTIFKNMSNVYPEKIYTRLGLSTPWIYVPVTRERCFVSSGRNNQTDHEDEREG
jgi:hypothetical protein